MTYKPFSIHWHHRETGRRGWLVQSGRSPDDAERLFYLRPESHCLSILSCALNVRQAEIDLAMFVIYQRRQAGQDPVPTLQKCRLKPRNVRTAFARMRENQHAAETLYHQH